MKKRLNGIISAGKKANIICNLFEDIKKLKKYL